MTRKKDVVIYNAKGEEHFRLDGVEAPDFWGDMAIDITASKYFADGEKSIYEPVGRVVTTLKDKSIEGHPVKEMAAELHDMLINQYFAFNTPVWLNFGVHDNPQGSACFISSINDNMESIIDSLIKEFQIYRRGSGNGINYSNVRRLNAPVREHGKASGPMSFAFIADAMGNVVKSGGTSRRAAKMVILNDDHPDIEEFAVKKMKEELKAKALMDYDAMYCGRFGWDDGSFENEAYQTVAFQNCNMSIGTSDEFMESVEDDADWDLISVQDGTKVVKTIKAADLFDTMAEAAHACGDPALFFLDACNRYHMTPSAGDIEASNPCAEFVFINESACNLGALNLLKYIMKDGSINRELLARHVIVAATAMDAVVDVSGYPNEQTHKNSIKYRPLGLSFTNLGACLMRLGLPYDSEDARAWVNDILAFIRKVAWETSAGLAEKLGTGIAKEDQEHMDLLLKGIAKGPFRNAQMTLSAPQGTTSFFLGAETTGNEPYYSLVTYKAVVGGGTLKLMPDVAMDKLVELGYNVSEVIEYMDNHYGDPSGILREEDRPLFATAQFGIEPMGHVRMMEIIQRNVDGAISKTVNLPESATVEDIKELYMEAWRRGLKGIAIYRNNCKGVSVLSSTKDPTKKQKGLIDVSKLAPHVIEDLKKQLYPERVSLPDKRSGETLRFEVAGHKGYATLNYYPNGKMGELFIEMAKEGSFLSGVYDAWATAMSIGLQYGVPAEVFIEKFKGWAFDPSGMTSNPDIPMAKSIIDFIARHMEMNVRYDQGVGKSEGMAPEDIAPDMGDIMECPDCQGIAIRQGSCYKCQNCGTTTGCS